MALHEHLVCKRLTAIMALFGSCLSLLKDKMFCQLLQWPFMSSWIVKSCSLLFCWTPLWRSLMGNLMLGFTIWEVNWETTMSHLSLPSFLLVQCTVQSVYRFSLSLWSATAISDVARACRSKKMLCKSLKKHASLDVSDPCIRTNRFAKPTATTRSHWWSRVEPILGGRGRPPSKTKSLSWTSYTRARHWFLGCFILACARRTQVALATFRDMHSQSWGSAFDALNPLSVPTLSTCIVCFWPWNLSLVLLSWLHLQYGCMTLLYFCTWANWDFLSET